MKKLLSIIVCITMLVVTASPAIANEPMNDFANAGLEAYANEVISEYIQISIGTVQSTDTFFLTQGYRVINNPDTYSRTFFLFQNGKCVGQLIATYVNGEYASSFTQYDIPAVTEAYENNEPFALIAENQFVVLLTEDSTELISGTGNYISQVDYENVLIDYEPVSASVEFVVQSADEIQVEDDGVWLNVSYVANETTSLGNGLCWAATTSSLGYYHSGGTLYSAMQIYDYLCDHYGVDGYYGIPRGTLDWEQRALLIYEYYGTKGSGGLTYSQVKTKLQNNYPVLANIYPDSGIGHAVIICGCGYSGSGSIKYKLRDPNKPNYVYVSDISLTSTNFTYVSGTMTYTTWSGYVW